MKYHVRPLLVTENAIRQVSALGRPSDHEYAEKMGYSSLREALQRTIDASALVYGIYQNAYCVALAGALEDVGEAQVWIQTSSMTDGEPRALLRAVKEALNLVHEADPEKELWAAFRDDEKIKLLARAMGFTKYSNEYDINGIKHFIARR